MTSTLKTEKIQFRGDNSDAMTLSNNGGVTLGGTGGLHATHGTTGNNVATIINTTANSNANGVLHVKQTGATNQPTMVIEQTGEGGNSSDTQGLHIKIAGQNQGTGQAIRVTTVNSNLNSGSAYDAFSVTNGGELNLKNSSNVSTLTLDQSGRLKKPLNPRFSVYRGGSEQFINTSNSSSVGVAIDWAVAEINVGSHFDLGNNRFQAPVTGTYRFDFSMLTGLLIPSSGVYWATFFLAVGGSTSTRIAGTPLTYWESYNSSGSANAGQGGSGRNFTKVVGGGFADLAAGNTVQLMLQASDSSNVRVHSATHSLWSGYLIG